MPPPLISADPQLRARLLVWGTCVVGMGIGCLFFLKGRLDRLAALSTAAPELAAEQFQRLAVRVAALLLVLTGAVGSLGSYLALRILRTGQYPPPGLRVVRDTPLRTGRPARRVALLLGTLAALVFLGGLGLSVVLWRVTQVSQGGGGRPKQEAGLSENGDGQRQEQAADLLNVGRAALRSNDVLCVPAS